MSGSENLSKLYANPFSRSPHGSRSLQFLPVGYQLASCTLSCASLFYLIVPVVPLLLSKFNLTRICSIIYVDVSEPTRLFHIICFNAVPQTSDSLRSIFHMRFSVNLLGHSYVSTGSLHPYGCCSLAIRAPLHVALTATYCCSPIGSMSLIFLRLLHPSIVQQCCGHIEVPNPRAPQNGQVSPPLSPYRSYLGLGIVCCTGRVLVRV